MRKASHWKSRVSKVCQAQWFWFSRNIGSLTLKNSYVIWSWRNMKYDLEEIWNMILMKKIWMKVIKQIHFFILKIAVLIKLQIQVDCLWGTLILQVAIVNVRMHGFENTRQGVMRSDQASVPVVFSPCIRIGEITLNIVYFCVHKNR